MSKSLSFWPNGFAIRRFTAIDSLDRLRALRVHTERSTAQPVRWEFKATAVHAMGCDQFLMLAHNLNRNIAHFPYGRFAKNPCP